MKQITLRILHKGCWVSELTAKCKGVKLIHMGHYSVLKRTKQQLLIQSNWQIRAKNKIQLDNFFAMLKKYSKIKSFDIVQRSDSRALIFVKYDIKYSQFEMALRKGAIPGEPVVVENGVESWKKIYQLSPREILELSGYQRLISK